MFATSRDWFHTLQLAKATMISALTLVKNASLLHLQVLIDNTPLLDLQYNITNDEVPQSFELCTQLLLLNILQLQVSRFYTIQRMDWMALFRQTVLV